MPDPDRMIGLAKGNKASTSPSKFNINAHCNPPRAICNAESRQRKPNAAEILILVPIHGPITPALMFQIRLPPQNIKADTDNSVPAGHV